jgi:hypothetical protein
LKFISNNQICSDNLLALEKANLVQIAVSLQQPLFVHFELLSKRMLAYGREAIIVTVNLIAQRVPKFKKKFFNLIFANSLQSNQIGRSNESLLILLALYESMDTESIGYL